MATQQLERSQAGFRLALYVTEDVTASEEQAWRIEIKERYMPLLALFLGALVALHERFVVNIRNTVRVFELAATYNQLTALEDSMHGFLDQFNLVLPPLGSISQTPIEEPKHDPFADFIKNELDFGDD